jgi:hypothetical protein
MTLGEQLICFMPHFTTSKLITEPKTTAEIQISIPYTKSALVRSSNATLPLDAVQILKLSDNIVSFISYTRFGGKCHESNHAFIEMPSLWRTA